MKIAGTKRALPALVLTLLAAIPTLANAGRDRWFPAAEGQQGFAAYRVAERRVTLEQAIDTVQRATGGRVLDAKDVGGQYRIKILTRNGEVRIVYVDAQTGEMR